MEDWKLQLGVNLYGVIHGLHIFTPSMVAQGTEAKIAATSSFAGLLNTSTLGLGAGTPYTVSKHAVTLTMEAMAHELRNMEDCQVSAHVLCPAAVASKYLDTAIELSEGDDARKEKLAAAVTGAPTAPQPVPQPAAALILEQAALTLLRAWLVAGMQAKAMTPDEMSTVLRDELAAGKFYVIGFDEGRKRHTFPIISTAAPSAPLPSAISAVSLEMPAAAEIEACRTIRAEGDAARDAAMARGRHHAGAGCTVTPGQGREPG